MKNCTLTTTKNKNSILVQHSGFARLVQHSGLHFVAMVITHDVRQTKLVLLPLPGLFSQV